MTGGRLAGKVAIVTGASRGIGRAIVRRFAGEGACVAAFARSGKALDSLARDVNARHAGTCVPMVGDVTNADDVRKAVKRTASELGPADLLVNNAGIGVFKPLSRTTEEDFIRLFRTNVLGAVLFCKEALKTMRRRGGKIINVASTAGRKGYVNQTAYCASKHALLGLSKALSLELRGTGVSVHVISPGGVDTDLARRGRPDVNVAEYMEPEEVAEVALFIAAMEGKAAIDEVVLRRTPAQPWGY